MNIKKYLFSSYSLVVNKRSENEMKTAKIHEKAKESHKNFFHFARTYIKYIYIRVYGCCTSFQPFYSYIYIFAIYFLYGHCIFYLYLAHYKDDFFFAMN